ncbi:ABC-2 transporter permease [Microbacterium sp. cf332]|uniref:ABC-2 transporter permease n=1 Tax=Microbacterium sp. cf332 TaxID=1761804 RepID=UPI00088DAC41|nr:ABC-2 transporter permease [Microbacterium sp. cf332]SDQ48905.1 ABC-2 family transporter protein [Microbacterium sp. cf332]
MSTVAFTRFDLQTWLPRKQSLLPLAFIIVVGVAVPVPGTAVLAAAFVTSFMISAPFLSDERGGLDTLYGILPISRARVVAGRTTALVIYYVICCVVAIVTTVGVASVRGNPLPAGLLGLVAVALAAGFAFVGLALALQLPVLFRVGYTRGRLVAYAPALVVAALLWLNQLTGAVEITSELTVPVGAVIATAIGVGLGGLLVGAFLAGRVYRAREIR